VEVEEEEEEEVEFVKNNNTHMKQENVVHLESTCDLFNLKIA
jgi:hypothetical protein